MSERFRRLCSAPTTARSRGLLLLASLTVGGWCTGCVLADDYYLLESEDENTLTATADESRSDDDAQSDDSASGASDSDESLSSESSEVSGSAAANTESSMTAELDGVADEQSSNDVEAADIEGDVTSGAESEPSDVEPDDGDSDDGDSDDAEPDDGDSDDAEPDDGDSDDAEPDDAEADEVDSDDGDSDDTWEGDLDAGTSTSPRGRDERAPGIEPDEGSDPGVESDPEPTPQCGEGWSYDPDSETCASDCGEDEARGPTGRCYWFTVQTQAFNAAESTCEKHGEEWTLIMPKSEEEDEFLQSQLTADTWIGARDNKVANRWTWGDETDTFWSGNEYGGPVDDAYTNWGSGEPSAANDEVCARYHGDPGEMKWSDGDCGDRQRVACQGPEPVEPTFD